MKVVIDIPDEICERFSDELIQHAISNEVNNAILDAFCNGTPLPKGHGRIGDLDRLYNVFERNVVGASAFKDLFDIAPAIIEADKGGNK